MPPLVTVSAAHLSTNTRSKRGRNFLNACPAMTLAAAVSTLFSLCARKERPAVGPAGHVNLRKNRPARRRTRPTIRPTPREREAAEARATIRPESSAQPPDGTTGGGRKEAPFPGFSKSPAQVNVVSLRPLPEITQFDP